MAWKKDSDKSGTHPLLLATAELPDADDRTVNEVAGFVQRLASESAAHTTDYFVNLGLIQMIGLARWRILLAQCISVGLIEQVMVDGQDRFKLVEDGELFHIRTRAELEWDRQRQRDNDDPHLTVHVRRRDGDNCRWCGVGVAWRGRDSNRKGTLDHLEPGKPARVETMVVCCWRCNTSRKDDTRWDDEHSMRPAPERPNYGKWTAAFLTTHGYPTRPNIGPDALTDPTLDPAAPTTHVAPGARPGSSADTAAPSAPVAAGARPAARDHQAEQRPRGSAPGSPDPSSADTAAPATQVEPGARPAARDDQAEQRPRGSAGQHRRRPGGSPSRVQSESNSDSMESQFLGSGRDGSGWEGKGRAGSAADGAQRRGAGDGRRRRRRGGRGRRGQEQDPRRQQSRPGAGA